MLTPSLSQNPPATRSDRPEDHSAELVSHARDLERGGELEAAAQVYSQVLTLLPEGEGDSAIQVANRRLAALEGRGGFQLETLEVFAGQFLNQALDPAMIFSFLVAGNVGAGTARGISALLQGRARSAFLQRGMGNLLAQNLGSLAAEVPAFVGTHRLLQGQPARTWGEDLASAGIFLGTLKAFHLATPLLAQSLSPNFRYPRALAHGGSLAGIFTAQGLEEAAGLTPHREFTDRFRDTFATFFQLQVAGKILSPIQRSSLLPQNIPSLPRLSLPGDFSRLQSSRSRAQPLAASLSPAEEARWSPLTPKQAESLLKKFEARLGFRPDAEMTQQIVDTGVALESLDSFANLLVHSEVKDAEFLRPVLSRLRHMTQKSDKRGISGNYFNWTTRLALRAIVHRQNRRDLREWIHHMDRGGSLAEHEAMLARILPGVQLQGARAYSPKYLAGKVAKSIQAVLRRVPLNLESIYTVLRFLDTQERMGESLLRKLPERDVWDVLEMFLDERPGMRPFMEGQLKEVAESPAGYLRFHRLYRLMLHEPFQDSKFRELAAKDFVLRPVTREGQAKESFTKNVADSIYDGYVNHRTLSLYLGDLYQHQAMLTDPMRVREARIERNAAIRRVWPENGPLTQEKIVQLLEELGDPISHRVARAVRAGEVEIKVMLNREFNDFVEKHNADQPGYLTSAVFAPRALTGEPDALIIRQVDLVSHEVFPEMAFRRIQSVIHEFEHFEEPPASPRTPSATFREEMTAHARTLYWRAIHGDIAELEQMQRESSQSLGMTLRDRVDSWYLPQPKD